MANPTMTLIGSPITVGSGGASSVTFSSIPATYTDLVVKASARTTSASNYGDFLTFTYNGSSSNRSDIRFYGLGSDGKGTNAGTTMYAGLASASGQTASTFGNLEMYIPNYASSNYKSSSVDGVAENNSTISFAMFSANLWSDTSAITSISLITADSFVQYSTFYLYGISNS